MIAFLRRIALSWRPVAAREFRLLVPAADGVGYSIWDI